MYVGPDTTYPVLGALYHPPGGIIRHDAVVWGFARGADAGGAEIHPYTEVTGLERQADRITGVHTNRGDCRRRDGSQLHRRLVDADLRDGRRTSCRSPPTSCRRA